MAKLLLRGGTLLQAEKDFEPLSDAAIVVEGSKIKWVGKESSLSDKDYEQVLDVGGKTILPGLIDAHTHLAFNGKESLFKLYKDPRDKLILEAIQSVATTIRSGVTTVRDVGGFEYVDVLLKNLIAEGAILGPRMFVSGKMVTATGGHCHVIAEEADGVAEVKKASRNQVKNGADIVKMMVTGGGATAGQNVESTFLDAEEISAAVGVARSLFRKSAAHAHGATGIKLAVRGGVDAIEHGSFLDEEGAQLMAKNKTYLVLTLGFESMFDELDADWEARMEPVRARARETIAIAMAAGVPIAAGTDAGGNPYAPHGLIKVVLQEMLDNGMTPAQILKSITISAADLLDASSWLGSLEPGKAADILVLDASPLDDITNIDEVAHVLKDGQIIR